MDRIGRLARGHAMLWRRALCSVIIVTLCMMTYALSGFKSARATQDPGERKPYTETIPGFMVRFEMVPIPGGKIKIADPEGKKPPREVEVKPFWMGKMEVTWDEYDIFAFQLDLPEEQREKGRGSKSRPSKPYGAPDFGFGHKGYPALTMTFYAATRYCEWLSQKTGKKYRLPTEAEWEWACRAGSDKPPADLDRVAWFWDNS
ncbi:MAG: SUMF1/EgtB/PvdO family nonheme iron enzyme, partial [Chloroherpetonaceae bacterium]|nr:formylglycine-generating enzyme family protein [Chthonomonadaceae bacterium]MDW8206963.1 SUMF1/EgtB/PvdO family nonheme iron enzyme [Chloroherpetonaceae bacterium]